MMKVVVVRYNENIEWTKQLSNVVICNKGNPLPEDYTVIPMENVGREGHAYYKYICDHYDDLESHTAFLQGNPFDHSPNIIAQLEKWVADTPTQVDFQMLSQAILLCNLSGCRHHPGLPMVDVYETLFGERKETMAFLFGAGAQFIVSRKQIHKRPREFYQKIVDLLSYDCSPIEGYVIERFHPIIFGDVYTSDVPTTVASGSSREPSSIRSVSSNYGFISKLHK